MHIGTRTAGAEITGLSQTKRTASVTQDLAIPTLPARTVSSSASGAGALRQAEGKQGGGFFARLGFGGKSAPSGDLAQVAATAGASKTATQPAVSTPPGNPAAPTIPGQAQQQCERALAAMAPGQSGQFSARGAVGVGIAVNLLDLAGPIASQLGTVGVSANLAGFMEGTATISRDKEGSGFTLTLEAHAGTEGKVAASIGTIGAEAAVSGTIQTGGMSRQVLKFANLADAAAFQAGMNPLATVTNAPGLGDTVKPGSYVIDTAASLMGASVRGSTAVSGFSLQGVASRSTGNGKIGSISKSVTASSTTTVTQTDGGTVREWHSAHETRAIRGIISPFRSATAMSGGLTTAAGGTATLRAPDATVQISLSKIAGIDLSKADGIARRDQLVAKMTARLEARVTDLNSSYGGKIDASGLHAAVADGVDRALSMRDQLLGQQDGLVKSTVLGMFKTQAVTMDFAFEGTPETGFQIAKPELTFDNAVRVEGGINRVVNADFSVEMATRKPIHA